MKIACIRVKYALITFIAPAIHRYIIILKHDVHDRSSRILDIYLWENSIKIWHQTPICSTFIYHLLRFPGLRIVIQFWRKLIPPNYSQAISFFQVLVNDIRGKLILSLYSSLLNHIWFKLSVICRVNDIIGRSRKSNQRVGNWYFLHYGKENAKKNDGCKIGAGAL